MSNLVALATGRSRHLAAQAYHRLISDIKDAGAVENVENGNVVLSASVGLAVDADMLGERGLAAHEGACHGAVRDRLHCIPGDTDQRSCNFHRAASLKNFDGEVLDKEAKSRVCSGPWRQNCFDSVFRVPAAAKAGDQLRRERHRVQVPPAPLGRMIGEAAKHAALGALNTKPTVGKADLEAPILDLKVNRLHPLGVIEANQTGVMRLECVNVGTLSYREPPMNRPRRATEIPEGQR
ncbi:MAG: hypothetical protein WCJ31_10900 [Planctomycetia bacterium]